MTELREKLAVYNLGLNSFAQMTHIGRNTLRKYELDPMSIGAGTRKKIEVGLEVLERGEFVRPVMTEISSPFSWYKGVHDTHVMNVLKYERELRKAFNEEMMRYHD